MKNLLKVIIIVIIGGMLAACMNTNDDEKQSENNEQNNTNNEQTEENNDQDNPDGQKDYDGNKNNKVRNNKGKSNRNKNGKHHKNHHERKDRTPTNKNNQEKVVIENDAFQIFEPSPKSNVKKKIVVSGLASVPEGEIHYTLENCHSVLKEGTTTASKDAPDWGEFEFTIEQGKAKNCSAKIILSEDGSKTNELIIPVHLDR